MASQYCRTTSKPTEKVEKHLTAFQYAGLKYRCSSVCQDDLQCWPQQQLVLLREYPHPEAGREEGEPLTGHLHLPLWCQVQAVRGNGSEYEIRPQEPKLQVCICLYLNQRGITRFKLKQRKTIFKFDEKL